MQFIVLLKFRRKPTSKDLEVVKKTAATAQKRGLKIHMQYWTLGRYDAVWVAEAKNEKEAMKFLLSGPGLSVTETLIAVPRDQAVKFL